MSQKEYSVTDLCEVLRLAFAKNNQTYFGYAWREKLGEFLEEESRYARLVDWLNEEIEFHGSVINPLGPAENGEEFEETYLKEIQDYAVLIHLRDLLLDDRTTTQMRENIEKWLCKRYKIRYWGEYFDGYM